MIPAGALLAGAALTACSGAAGNRGTVGSSGTVASSGTVESSGTSSSGTATPGSGGTGMASGSASGASSTAGSTMLLPARIRRLTNAEFDASTHAILGTNQKYASTLPPDVRQGSFNAGGFPAAGFTRNAAAVFDAVSTPQLQQAAINLGQEAAGQNLATVAPCPTGSSSMTCAASFIATLGAKAYRRPLTADEQSGLLTVYLTGSTNRTYAGGVSLTVETILQSAGFVYITELGGTPTNGVAELTSYEVASSLSYFITGGPPDAQLMQAAAADALQDPKAVAAQATRLLGQSSGQLATFVEQWLGVDSPPGTSTGAKASGSDMAGETTAFIEDVMANGDGSLNALLTNANSFVNGSLASLYGLQTPSGTGFVKTANPQRIGILNQASFLSTYAHSSFSAPVKRGHLVRTQMLCDAIPPPSPSLNVNVSPPLPTAAETTRQADIDHMTSAACSGCHLLMDPIGWGFENFDGNGAYRTTEAGMMIDPSGTFNLAADLTGPFTNDATLIEKLAGSATVQQCYMKKFADFAAAETDPDIEAVFLDFWQSQPASVQTSLPQLVAAFVQSDLFLKRAVQ